MTLSAALVLLAALLLHGGHRLRRRRSARGVEERLARQTRLTAELAPVGGALR